jgi:Domain of unknown function (DUF4926)
MINELETVVLVKDIDKYSLRQDDVGAVIHCYQDGKTFEVEFVTGEGQTVAVLTLTEEDVRPMRHREILHVRELTPA